MFIKSLGLAVVLATLSIGALANEAVIRKSLAEKVPNFPKPDEVRLSPMPGLWEVRHGNEIRYTDATGQFLIEGELIDLKSKKNLTDERISKLNQIDFSLLPLKDAVVWKTGNGKRRIAVFADPNCGYCKRLERSLQDLKDVTVYTFVVAILGGDSPDKARSIWCAKEQTNSWRNWMLDGVPPVRVAAGACDDSAIERNQAFARKHHVNATPAILFEDGTRVPGAINAEQIERRLQALVSGSKS
ncbi:DsbC family protein [Pelomonas sp. SE-A7]|uniref:DsbC family protein n=1 Tax=Pelomonas sp. SE-A7 TaxID=3054953 RepID=UPI00259CB6F5|nr:DsbC family protein [Pelomonas sp. SE-A7]MDM4767571.1 DsbC family protein [Pelomonas sp. SE-A7]